jgi:hypothetical protein
LRHHHLLLPLALPALWLLHLVLWLLADARWDDPLLLLELLSALLLPRLWDG